MNTSSTSSLFSKQNGIFNTAVIVAALGYFVDVYDLVLFSMVRIKSLNDLGFTGTQVDTVGMTLHNYQMVGMLLGGIFWGILGDKKGRLSVLFASIITYSLANIANGFIGSIEAYSFWRFVAGFGLAGELGVGITLVAEIMPKETRGYGTMLVASIGVTGAIVAALASVMFDWKTTYIIGGVLGLALLLLRISVFESGIFSKLKEKKVERGNFLSLFSSWPVFSKYMKCILIGVPIWFSIGLLIMYGTKFFRIHHTIENGPVMQSYLVMVGYIGLTFGDLASGLLSQVLGSRKKAVLVFLAMMMVGSVVYLVSLPYLSLSGFYWICGALGFTCGYWAVFVTIAAEQFGTNIRATVATTAPNFVRGAFVLINTGFVYFSGLLESDVAGAYAIGACCFVVSLVALYFLEETFGKDLNFEE
ncbi:MAG: MFS transporter [Cytophagaceae bacterium]|jgi:MFS family permease|nr:MFS transporter [Cytophagaceae bacterium]